MISLHLTQNNVKLNGLILDINQIRSIELSVNPVRMFDLQKDIILNVIDDLGIKYWTKNDKIIQTQIVLDKQPKELDDPKMPINLFNGSIILLNQTLVSPVVLSNFIKDNNVKLIKDMDSLQYKINIYYAYLGGKKYTLWVDEEDVFITSIYF